MRYLKEIFATGLADRLYRHDFENIGKYQWENNKLVANYPWIYVVGEVGQMGDRYESSVSTKFIPGVTNGVGGEWVTIWRSKEYKTSEEALGVLTRHVRICQNKFPHLLFLRTIRDNKTNKVSKCQEFLDNEWVIHPYNHPYANDWEPLRSVVKRCSRCNYFDDGLDAYFNDDDEKLFAYDDNVSQCRKNNEFKCQQLKQNDHEGIASFRAKLEG